MHLNKLLILIAWLLSMEYFSALEAHAYVDFGTGSVIAQAIAAFFISAGFFFKDKFFGIFSIFSPKAKEENTETEDDEPTN